MSLRGGEYTGSLCKRRPEGSDAHTERLNGRGIVRTAGIRSFRSSNNSNIPFRAARYRHSYLQE